MTAKYSMSTTFVRVLCDVHCEWEGFPPSYRVWLDDELFAERTWTWTDVYLEELLQVSAPPGQYRIRHELLLPHQASLHVENIRIELTEDGTAEIVDGDILKVIG